MEGHAIVSNRIFFFSSLCRLEDGTTMLAVASEEVVLLLDDAFIQQECALGQLITNTFLLLEYHDTSLLLSETVVTR